ncbi:MAG: ATP-binding protein [Bacteroidia bacterium]|nr:MAG: ATP-binding protein [Bacteroidia bacterium]
MKRLKQDALLAWKNSINRKPLIIKGARQVGKTWLMKAFGEAYYTDTVYLNFEKTTRLQNLFDDDFDLQRIIIAIQAETGKTITEGDVLLIFDEIQAAPRAITSLKYFQEDAPGIHVIAAGSLLGIALHANISFPVGKIDFLDLHPMNFMEFLMACNETGLIQILESNDWKLITAFKSKFIERLRQYYYVGGMPEAVMRFCANGNFVEVRSIQKQILTAYEQDFSKHPQHNIVPRIRMAWNSIPSQLAKENRKFVYGAIKKGARAKDFELALSWLLDCQLLHKLHRVSKPSIPLKAYVDLSAFRLFLVDVGLLAAMGDIDAKTLLEGNAIFSEFKGALSEQYVIQELISAGDFAVYYWTAKRATAEVDFVLQYQGMVLPVEVKAEENLQSKSLKVFHQKFSPPVALRLSMSDYRIRDWLVNVPLYAVSRIKTLA